MDGILYDFDLGHGFHVCICDASYINMNATGCSYIITTEDGREIGISRSIAHQLVTDSDIGSCMKFNPFDAIENSLELSK